MSRTPQHAPGPEPEAEARRPTIVDVARHAGVSKSLASRALRGDAGVSGPSRLLVQQAAGALGYRPNSAARSLVRGVSGLIGVVLNEIGNQHHTEIVAGVEDQARTLNASVLIGHGGHSALELCRQIDTMIELRVDGLVIVSSWVPGEVLERAGGEVPTVLLTQVDNPPPVIDTIASDDVAGARMATEHLINAGSRRPAYLTRSRSATSRARTEGVLLACQAAGLPWAVEQFDPGQQRQLAELVGTGRYDAVLCNNDLTAAEVIRAAHDHGLRIPGDLQVIGYDNTRLARFLFPSLSSVDQPQYLMGQRAVAAITERREGRTTAVREFYTPQLVERASTGQPHN
ncbi:LacI family transcriptional regulator [Glutamicibacter sp. MNS18]|uniref:LacI family DNA-binding transcriptional regulator n=1 Tax=Glutamicibacter sp. MNS18 TaxID=2989817 RepID=UPI00223562AD|nr:LacI family DNA-binding transcriptional regulator [Glutamicibacter sp. MNS18]MCW4466546.1 LacI family transcriptional regulator [Glutamicibacter sp. MNS18]